MFVHKPVNVTKYLFSETDSASWAILVGISVQGVIVPFVPVD